MDWAPLAGGDPVGGDPDAVVVEAVHYRSMAEEIASQVGRLRRIGAGGELVGRSAEQVRATAGQSAERLDRTQGAYRVVAGALSAWVPQLESAHRESLQALSEAQEAQRRLDRQAEGFEGDPGGAVEEGLVARDQVTDLGAVLAGEAPGRPGPEAVTLFDSTGLAIQDLAIAAAAVAAWRDGRVEAQAVRL